MPSVTSGGNLAPSIHLLQRVQDLRLEQRFTFQQENDPKHTATTTQEWLRDTSLNVLDWPSQNLDLNPIERLWRDLRIAVQRHSPSNLTELERICRVEWEKPTNIGVPSLMHHTPEDSKL